MDVRDFREKAKNKPEWWSLAISTMLQELDRLYAEEAHLRAQNDFVIGQLEEANSKAGQLTQDVEAADEDVQQLDKQLEDCHLEVKRWKSQAHQVRKELESALQQLRKRESEIMEARTQPAATEPTTRRYKSRFLTQTPQPVPQTQQQHPQTQPQYPSLDELSPSPVLPKTLGVDSRYNPDKPYSTERQFLDPALEYSRSKEQGLFGSNIPALRAKNNGKGRPLMQKYSFNGQPPSRNNNFNPTTPFVNTEQSDDDEQNNELGSNRPRTAPAIMERSARNEPPKQCLPNPETFTGDRRVFKTWLFSMRNKLLTDKAYFEYQGPETTVNWVGTRVSGDAFNWIERRLPASGQSPNPFQSPEEIFHFLAGIYGEFDEAARVKDQYDTLEMKDTDTFDKFYAEFSHLAAYLGKPADEAYWDLFTKLNDKYQRKATNMTHTKLEELVDVCRSLKYRFRVQDRKKQRLQTSVSAPRTFKGHSRPYSSPFSSAAAVPSEGKALTRSHLPSQIRNHPAYVPEEQRKRLTEEKKSWTCFQPGHRARSPKCPLKDFEPMFAAERAAQGKAVKNNLMNLEPGSDSDLDYNDQNPDYSDDDGFASAPSEADLSGKD